MSGSYDQQRLLLSLQNLVNNDAGDVVVPAPKDGLKILECVDFGSVNLGIAQPDLNAVLGRQLQVCRSDMGEEIDEAQIEGSWQPADHIGPDVTKLRERHVLATDVTVHDVLRRRSAEFH